MSNEEMVKNFTNALSNPLFKMNFFEFYKKMQQEGIDAAKKFWSMNPATSNLFATPEIFEKMIDFYIILGFVPSYKYDKLLRENEKLREENKLLKNAMQDLQYNIFKEGGEKAQQTWTDIMDKQFEMNREIAKNFFDMFSCFRGSKVS